MIDLCHKCKKVIPEGEAYCDTEDDLWCIDCCSAKADYIYEIVKDRKMMGGD